MELKITHTTQYSYDQPVRYGLQRARLRPADNALQTVRDWNLSIDGGAIEISHTDHHGNLVDLLAADVGVTEVSITASGTVETHDRNGILGPVYGVAPLWYFTSSTSLTQSGREIRALSRKHLRGAEPLTECHDLSEAIRTVLPYTPGVTTAKTAAEDALRGTGGVCQDHAQIFISAARIAGFPARYVSGYLMMNDRVDQDASHGWAEVHLEGLGWTGFDISNGISPDERYVRLAIGRDAREAAPITGLRVGPTDESMIVTVQVQQ